MKKLVLLALLAVGFAVPFAQAQTTLSATRILDGNGNLLSSGNFCIGSSCYPVTNGAIAPGSTLSTAVTANVTVTASYGTILTVNSVTVVGSYFSWDSYILPSSGTASGIGRPRMACSIGASYSQTDSTASWNCQANAGVVGWVQGAATGITPVNEWLSLSGGTMLGPLYLQGDPSQPNQAATMHYVQEEIASSGGASSGTAPSSYTGNTTKAVSASGTFTPGDALIFDASLNAEDAGGPPCLLGTALCTFTTLPQLPSTTPTGQQAASASFVQAQITANASNYLQVSNAFSELSGNLTTALTNLGLLGISSPTAMLTVNISGYANGFNSTPSPCGLDANGNQQFSTGDQQNGQPNCLTPSTSGGGTAPAPTGGSGWPITQTPVSAVPVTPNGEYTTQQNVSNLQVQTFDASDEVVATTVQPMANPGDGQFSQFIDSNGVQHVIDLDLDFLRDGASAARTSTWETMPNAWQRPNFVWYVTDATVMNILTVQGSGSTITVTLPAPPPFGTNVWVTLSSISDGSYDGGYMVKTISGNTFTVSGGNSGAAATGGYVLAGGGKQGMWALSSPANGGTSTSASNFFWYPLFPSSVAGVPHMTFSGYTMSPLTATTGSMGGSYTPSTNVIVTGLDVQASTAPAGCSTYPSIGVYDTVTGTLLGSVQLGSGALSAHANFYGAGAIGHRLSFGVSTAASGCSTNADYISLNAEYITQQ